MNFNVPHHIPSVATLVQYEPWATFLGSGGSSININCRGLIGQGDENYVVINTAITTEQQQSDV